MENHLLMATTKKDGNLRGSLAAAMGQLSSGFADFDAVLALLGPALQEHMAQQARQLFLLLTCGYKQYNNIHVNMDKQTP